MRAAELVATPGIGIGDSVKVRIYKACVRSAAVVRKGKSVTGSQTLIEPNPANLHARLERITAAHEGEVVDNAESGTDFVI